MNTWEETKARSTSDPRARQVNLRLSDAEYARLTKSSALRGLGRAAYLRMALMEKWRAEEREDPILFRPVE